jgi:hypothetical protein
VTTRETDRQTKRERQAGIMEYVAHTKYISDSEKERYRK